MKTFLYFLTGCAIIGFLISTIIGSLPVLPYASRALLMSVEKGQYQQAYNMFSKDYQSRHDFQEFVKIVRMSGLEDYKEVNWLKNVINEDHKEGHAVGIVTTKSNKKIPIKIDFIQLQGKGYFSKSWAIDDLKTGQAAIIDH